MTKISYKEIGSCRLCNSQKMTPILSLGELYVSDFVDSEIDPSEKCPLELILCNNRDGGCGLLQLRHTVSHEAMYRNYWYRSGMNKTMTDELHGIAEKVESIIDLKEGDYVLDIGANDGTLLRSYMTLKLNLIGFEPARNLGRHNAVGTTKIINDFFNYEAWEREFGNKKAKAVTAIAMFYDLENPNSFVSDVGKCLDKDGVFIIQMSYLPLMLSQNAFDNICHEHVEYYSLLSLENLLSRHDLEVFDIELNEVNGGSFRIYIRHRGGNINSMGGKDRVRELRENEAKIGLHDLDVYEKFVFRVNEIKKKVNDFIKNEISRGKKVYAYGASTKGNTLLQFFGLDNRLITAIAEKNPDKWGKKTVGTLMPIISEEEMRAQNPDYLLILPWHFLREFREREREFLKKGKFIVPLPEFDLISE